MILLSKNAKNAPTIYFKFGKVKTPSYLCKIQVNGKHIYSIHQIVTLLAHNSL